MRWKLQSQYCCNGRECLERPALSTCCSLLLSVGWTGWRWVFQVFRREWFSCSCLLSVLEKLGVLSPTTALLSFAYNSELNKVEVTSSVMDSKNDDWVCLCTSCISYCQTLFFLLLFRIQQKHPWRDQMWRKWRTCRSLFCSVFYWWWPLWVL